MLAKNGIRTAADRAARRAWRMRRRKRAGARVQGADAGARHRADPRRRGRRAAALSPRAQLHRHVESRQRALSGRPARWWSGMMRRRTAEGLRAWSAKDAAALAGLSAIAAAARRADRRRSSSMRRRRWTRRRRAMCLRLMQTLSDVPIAAEGRPVAVAAVGADGGRRSGQRGRSRPSCCAPRWPPTACLARCSVRGRPAAACSCC